MEQIESRDDDMFKTELSDDFSFMAWLSQQVGAVLVPVIWAMITADIPVSLGGLTYPIGKVAAFIWNAVFVWGIGFPLALVVHRLLPRAASAGRWVWVLPTFFFLLTFIGDSVMSSLGHAFSNLFYTGSNGEGEWATALITYPTSECALYSLAMYLASRRRRRSGPG
ncbi:MAG: hypothetical protein LAP38_17785 [Acidobacteriia bacterium]|nr:hypothetical protein [Terriglobia bacterium]